MWIARLSSLSAVWLAHSSQSDTPGISPSASKFGRLSIHHFSLHIQICWVACTRPKRTHRVVDLFRPYSPKKPDSRVAERNGDLSTLMPRGELFSDALPFEKVLPYSCRKASMGSS